MQKKRAVKDASLGLSAAASWPIFECWISSWWPDTSQLTEVLIAKEPPFGGVVTCTLMIDLGCLGLKNGFASQFRTRSEYQVRFRDLMLSRNPMISAKHSLAFKIIKESMRYAQELGFEPEPNARKALEILGSLNDAAQCDEVIRVGGHDGKPYFMSGPDDDVEKIHRQLVRKCGLGNFTIVASASQLPSDF